jgi:NADH-quinone oxidoreductase subunit N
VNLDYHALLPEFILAGTVLAVLVVDLLRVPKYWSAVVGLVGLFAAVVPVLTLGLCAELSFCEDTGVRAMLGDSYVVDTFSLVLKGLFLGGAFVSLLLSVGYLESDRYWQGEYYFLLLASTLGAVVMASSRDLITMFVALELVTGPTFLMAGWRKGDARSNEAALKFFIIGVLSAAVLLFGMSLVYGATGHVSFAGIRAASAAVSTQMEALFTLGVVFTIFGFAFKVSAVPFHFWTPDTYEGAPTPVTAYLSVVSKAAGFTGLLVVSYLAFANARDIWGPALWILAAVSMTVGNLVALRQTNIVRLLGYSSIAQGGFMLVPFGAVLASEATTGQLEDAFFATVTYLLIYAFMNLGAFAVIIAVRNRLGSAELDDWSGLFRYAPGLATLLGLFFFSLAGVPPLAGWFAKFVMFRSALSIGGGWAVALAVIAVVNAVIAFAYYAKVVKSTWFDPVPDGVDEQALGAIRVVPSLQLALGLTILGVLVLGIFPDLVADLGDLTAGFVE